MARVPRRSASLARRPGVPATLRRQWRAMYETTPYRDLPWFSDRPAPWIERGVDEGWLRRGDRVLDVGCGAGTNALFLARSGFRVRGLDLAPAAIAVARRRAARARLSIDFREGDALRLPFGSRSLEGVVDRGCYHTIPVRLRRAYSRELGRVLRPGGRYLVSWVARESTRNFGPPHRPSVEETALAFEPEFLFLRTEFERGRRGALSSYHGLLERRRSPQPPPR